MPSGVYSIEKRKGLFKKGLIPWNKGLRGLHKHSEETKNKIRITLKGRNRPPFSKEWKENISKAKKRNNPGAFKNGHEVSEEVKRKLSESGSRRIGELSPNWKGGISTYNRKLYLNARRRVKKNGAEGSHTQEEWELLKKQHNYKCPCCGRKEPGIKLTEDHIIPLDRDGSDYIENIQPLCRSCNSIKHTRIIKYKI